MRIRFICLLILPLCFFGCGGTGGSGGVGGGFGSGASGKIYVSNLSRNSILRWDQGTSTRGNTPPSAEISGASTKLNGPRGLFLDAKNDLLFVANFGSNSILTFNKLSSSTGDVVPVGNISGPSTNLDGPVALAVDTVRGFIYVSNSRAGNILVFQLTVDGDVAPVRTITSTFPFNSPAGIFLDGDADRLFVADSNNSAVQVFDNASTLIGDSKPVHRIVGSATTLNQPTDVTVAMGNLIVADKAMNAIRTFANAATADGNIAPQKSIIGSTTLLSSPVAIQVSGSSLFIGCPGNAEVTIFDDYSSVNGNREPTRGLAGDFTKLSGVNGAQGIAGLAFDSTR